MVVLLLPVSGTDKHGGVVLTPIVHNLSLPQERSKNTSLVGTQLELGVRHPNCLTQLLFLLQLLLLLLLLQLLSTETASATGIRAEPLIAVVGFSGVLRFFTSFLKQVTTDRLHTSPSQLSLRLVWPPMSGVNRSWIFDLSIIFPVVSFNFPVRLPWSPTQCTMQ